MSEEQKTEFSVTISERMDEADLYSPACTGALAESAQVIVEQNRRLLLRSQERSFNPATELDFTSNGAGLALQHLFEEVSVFREGCVPWRILRELFVTTYSLINALKQRKNAPVLAIDAVGVAFRECAIVWCDTHSPPRMKRETYLKKIFKGKAAMCEALKVLHAEYVRIAAAKGRKTQTLSAAKVLGETSGADDRIRIYREILRLENGGMTVKKTISAMMHGTYAARMRGVKPETWRRYYNDWKRHSAARKTEPIKSLSEPINALSEPINEPIKTEIQDCVFALIADNPGINRPEIIKHLKKCRSTVSRALVKLCASGRIEHRGSNKTGGYYATVPESAADCRKQVAGNRSTIGATVDVIWYNPRYESYCATFRISNPSGNCGYSSGVA